MSPACGYLIEMLGDHAPRFNQPLHGKCSLIGTHRKKGATVNHSKIDIVEIGLRSPISYQTPVAGPEDRKALGKTKHITGFKPCVTGQNLANHRHTDMDSCCGG